MDDIPNKIWVDGKSYEVTNEVYEVYIKYSRKMRYFEYDLKTEQFILDEKKQRIEIKPSREDSLERLEDEGRQFRDQRQNVEKNVVQQLEIERLYEAMKTLSKGEKSIIYAIYFCGKTERETAKKLGVSQTTVFKRKHVILEKLKKILEK